VATDRDPSIGDGRGRFQGSSPRARSPVVFLSYRRDDTEGHAGHLGEWLVRRFGRDNVFRDVDSVLPGEDFVARITDAIRSCDVVLVLIGKSWLTTLDAAGQRRIDSPRDYVRLEIEAALANGVRTIPVLFQNANMPDEHELPETIATLARLQASVVAAGRWEHDVERLLNVIGGPITPDADARTSSDRSKPLAGTVLTKARGLKHRLDNWPHPLTPAPPAPQAPAPATKGRPAAGTDTTGPRAFCRRCGQRFLDSAKFCKKCGTTRSTEE
jgi:hypothetical protein